MSKNSRWVVITSGDRSINEVKNEIAKKGFDVHRVLESLGYITGEVTNDNVVDKLRATAGVRSVEEQPPEINIGPPGASIS